MNENGSNDGEGSICVPETVSNDEFTEFLSRVEESWGVLESDSALYDVVVKDEEGSREILVDFRTNRVAVRSSQSGEWGLQQKPVRDVGDAVEKLQTTGKLVPLNELQYLGLNGHPDPPDSNPS